MLDCASLHHTFLFAERFHPPSKYLGHLTAQFFGQVTLGNDFNPSDSRDDSNRHSSQEKFPFTVTLYRRGNTLNSLRNKVAHLHFVIQYK